MIEVPLLDLKAQYHDIRLEIDAALKNVVESQTFILGPEVKELEQEIASYSGMNFGVGVSSGTDALLIALMILELEPGDEVITTAYSFFATAGAIARLGLRPVFVDIDPLTYNIDPQQIEAKITPRTRVIVPVHLYGQIAQVTVISELAERHGLFIIEDAAQAIGAEYHGKRSGSFGAMGCLSFFPSKNLGGFGDGGMVITNEPLLEQKLRLYRNHGYQPKYYSVVLGGNFRLDALQAAVLRVKLRYLDRWIAARQHNAAVYRRLFSDRDLSLSLEELRDGVAGIVLPTEAANRRHVYNQFVIRSRHRDELMDHLKHHRIGCEVYYPQPLHLQKCFSDLGYVAGDFPESEVAASETLAIPIYPELTEQMIERVVDSISDFWQRRSTP